MDSPAIVAVPSSAGSTPFSTLNNVVLPAPFGPMIPRISPSAMLKLTLLTARRPPKDFDSPSTVSNAAPVASSATTRGGGMRRRQFIGDRPACAIPGLI